jgi:hypothetical protein
MKFLAKIDNQLSKRTVRKIGWSIVGLIGPEVTMTIAAYERKVAWLLRKEMRIKMKELRATSADTSILPPSGSAEECSSGSGDAITPTDGSGVDDAQNAAAKFIGDKEEEGVQRCKVSRDWEDLSLSYYAVMGGFRVIYKGSDAKEATMSDNNHLYQGFLTGIVNGRSSEHPFDWTQLKEPAATLTPHGVLWMADKGYLPDVSPEAIKDKSKVNALAKTLVCFQAGWMMIQVIARAAAQQQVTLAELHTVLHTLCAATMYITVCLTP